MPKNPMRFTVCASVAGARKFYLQLKKEATSCCACGRTIDDPDDWSSLAQVQKNGTVVSGAICKVCHRSFARWMRSRRLAGRKREQTHALRDARAAAGLGSPLPGGRGSGVPSAGTGSE